MSFLNTLELMTTHREQYPERMPRMAGDASYSNDEAFLALLSSQRELLNKLNMETVRRAEQRTNHHQLMMHMAATAPMRHMNYHHGPFLGTDTMSLLNRPIIERRSSLDMLLAAASTSRRLSVGIGHDSFLLPTTGPFDIDDVSITEPKGELDLADVRFGMNIKRRRNSLENLGALHFEDLKSAAARRLSISSTLSKLGEVLIGGKDMGRFGLEEPAPCSFDDADDELHNQQQQQQQDDEQHHILEPTVQLDPSIDLPTLKVKISNFASAMEKSSKSQQDIHDWDKKMGLKRSHSKTMRLSMRSRKKLRSVMKQELQTLKSSAARS